MKSALGAERSGGGGGGGDNEGENVNLQATSYRGGVGGQGVHYHLSGASELLPARQIPDDVAVVAALC